MDERQFGALFDQHFADVWRFARRRCGDAGEADDIAAETFAVAWRRRDDLPHVGDVRLWLFGTARLALSNQRRSTGRRRRLHQRIEAAAVALPPQPDPADVVADRDGDPLLAALARLSGDDRDLLVMRAWDGLSVADIAGLLDVTPNAVSVRLHKARNRLAALLEGTDRTGTRTSSRRSHDPEGGAS
jgi:RNA polymerase sigma-70 factor (ECF subfamily)